MRVWHKLRQWFSRPVKRAATKPENAIVIRRPDGTPYMHMWLDMTYAESHKEPRVCMMFGGKLDGYKILWSAHTLPQIKTAIEQLLLVPLPPLPPAVKNS